MGHNWAHLLHMASHAVIHLVNHKKSHGHSAADAEHQRLAREQAERERQAALAHQARLQAIAWEEDRPKRNLRNLLRFAGCTACVIITAVLIANQNVVAAGFMFLGTIGAISAAKKSWEK